MDPTLQLTLELASDLEDDPDFQTTMDTDGHAAATAVCLAKNCIFSLAEISADHLLESVIRDAFHEMSSEAQGAFCEKGL